jgi:hypothetical protein
LPKWLGPATADGGAILLCLGTGPRARHVGDDDLMHQGFVIFGTEDAVRNVYAGTITRCQLHDPINPYSFA